LSCSSAGSAAGGTRPTASRTGSTASTARSTAGASTTADGTSSDAAPAALGAVVCLAPALGRAQLVRAGPHHPDEQPLEFYVCGNVNAFPYYDKNSQWAPAVGAILLF